MRRGTPNIGAVARAAGVSVGTVSNALNNPERLAPETLERVHGAIEKLGYIRSMAGRTLIQNASEDLGLIVPDLINRLFVEVARGAQLTARESGKRVVMSNSGYNAHDLANGIEQHDAQDDLLGYFAEARAGGVIVCSMREPSAGIERIRNHVRPIVLVNYDVPGADWCTVLMDNEQVGRAAVDHIADLGIRHAYFLSIGDIVQPVGERRRGAREAAARRGVHLTETTTAGLSQDAGAEIIGELLEPIRAAKARGERVALLFLADDLAIGAIRALRAASDLRIPDDVAIVGLDGDHRPNGNDWMSMTSIILPGYRMGAEAVRLLGVEAQPDHVHERVVVPVEIHPRATTIG
ncbi:transcriptional regulator [Microbacterium sorbitolivorans]|uniref:LacI family transcriptional regulator n=1 Tax=Microbacterium sorbitolivorans TaxID=1867410 RepID=A0A367XXA1_9MICO|nr:LacI family DNA-binding transcriptional regulator [Microbacterium sorbitolivorans]RCK58265.1 LacI family transcriptional regulator [Microbacterium sorbitolivorans]GGF38840.1 transcriptional regulator [Microbacterium sorbitolivorans]